MQTIFSGIQPTGIIHLGNYLGAIKNWKNIITNNTPNTNNHLEVPQNSLTQALYDKNSQFFFSIVDLHAITIHQNPHELKNSILGTLAIYLACGIEGENITVFQQSMVSQHAELAWVLSCNLQMGFLDRMTQYKEKTSQHKERACLGLYSYPVLMAADILLYNTNFVPVGEDQTQHIELTRDIAQKFNQKYNCNIFTLPKPILTEAKRVMSLKDATKKMSKSDESDMSRINILDDSTTIARKIQKAKTGKPEIQNLSNIYKAITNEEPNTESMSAFKNRLSDAIIAELSPIQGRYHTLMADSNHLHRQLTAGATKAKLVAQTNLTKIYTTIGLQ